jgi:hypothetical protein
MTMTYTWKVTGIKIKDEVNADGVTLPKAVCQTYWSKTGVDENGNEGVFAGATPFTAESVPADQFVAFDQLTEDVVLGWIKAVVVGHYEKHVNEMIAKQIADKAVTEQSMPWAPPAAEAPAATPAPTI